MRRVLAAAALASCGFVAAQEPRSDVALPASFSFVQPACVTTDELGRPIAIGPDWETEFDASGARFLPVLGNRSPVLMDLRLRAAGLRQGQHEVSFAAEAAPVVRGERVSYRRAEGIVERFDATDAGLEHSLVLERPVGGAGDLVVTIAIGGNAAAHGTRAADGGLCFSEGQGGVDYGTLTAIDARGVRCPGDVRLVPGAIEWVVPASFVEQAQYPLVLDPLVGSNFQVSFAVGGPSGGTWEADGLPDVAYDASTDSYLVVWQRVYASGGAAAQNSVRAQRIDGNGAAIGSVLAVSVVSTVFSGCVANCNLSNRFVVGFVYLDFFGTSQVRARTVAASDGAMSSTLLVATEPVGAIAHCDVAGESSTASSVAAEAWIVWNSDNQGVRGARLSVPASSTSVTVASTFAVAPSVPGLTWPRISRAPSAQGRLGVSWLVIPPFGGGPQVRAAVIDRSGSTVHSGTTVLATSDLLVSSAAIDGGGGATETEFVLVVSTAAFLNQSTTLHTLHAVPMVSATQLTVGAPIVLASEVGNAFRPDVGWRSGKAYVAYSSLANTRMVLRGIDPRTCQTCEGAMTVSQTIGAEVFNPAICMDRTGGSGSASTGLLVWDQETPGTAVADGTIRGRFLDAFSPLATTTNLGGGCGSAGATTTSGPPAVGNAGFQLRLQQPGPTALFAVLNVTSSSAPPLVCGACQWLPFESTIALPVSQPLTVAPVPIPCSSSLAGSTIDAQWTVWKPGTSPCALFPDFALSNILRLNLQ